MNTTRSHARLAFVLAIASSLVLAGCSASPTPEDTAAEPHATELVVAESVAPKTFDPIMSDVVATWYPWALAYETLVTATESGEILPALAETWSLSDDGLTYTFVLREGVTFHNGDTFDSGDVVASFTRLLNDAVPYVTSRFAALKEVRATDEKTVEFVLSQRDAGFLTNLGDPYAVGSAILSETALQSGDPATEMIGTGPYKMVAYKPDQELDLEAFDGYWGDAPANETLRIVYLPEQSAQTAALRNGQIDVMFPTAESARTLTGGQIKLESILGGTVSQLEINVDKNPALADVRVRNAIALSIDRKAIVDNALLGEGAPSAQIPASLGIAPDLATLPNYSRDLDAAKKLLADAGFADGIDLSLLTYGTASEAQKRWVEVVQSQLAESGIRVTIESLDFAAWLERFNGGDFELLANFTSYKADPLWYVKIRPGRHGATPTALEGVEGKILSAPSQEEYISLIQDYQVQQATLSWPNISLAAEQARVAYGPGVTDASTPPVSMTRTFLFHIKTN
ncbi:MAG: ABC transporter substrate-binding protein [Microbacterium sp.]